MRFLHKLNRTAVACAALPAAIAAAPSPAASGTDFIVNQQTLRDSTGNPLGYANHPSMKRGPAGNFIVSWAAATTATSPIATYAQVFTSYGDPMTAPVQVAIDTGLPTAYWTASLAVSKTGDSAVAWQQYDAHYNTHVMLQRLNAFGAPEGAVIDAGIQDSYLLMLGSKMYSAESTPPRIAMDDLGNLVVAWSTSREVRYGLTNNESFLKGNGSSATYLSEYAPDGTVLVSSFVADTQRSGRLGPCKPYQQCATNANMLQDLALNGGGDLVLMLSALRGNNTVTGATRYYTPGPVAVGGLKSYPDISGAGSFQAIGVDASGNYTIQWNQPSGTSIARYSSSGNQLGSTLGPFPAPDASTAYGPFSEMSSGELALPLCSYRPYAPAGEYQGWPTYSCTVQYYNQDLTPNGAAVVIPNNAADLNNGDLKFGVADDGSLATIWTAVLGSNSDNAILGALTGAP